MHDHRRLSALANPQVEVTVEGDRTPYDAVPVTGAEHDRVDQDNGLGFGFRILTGFPASDSRFS